MGAFKAGVSIVTFDEKENIDALSQTLRDSGARGFMFSPSTVISHDLKTNTEVHRYTFLQKLMPELHSLYPGDEMSVKAYPNLKQIIQLGHSTIRGVIKFKDAMVYANPKISTYEIPENSASDVAFQSYQNGKEVASFTSGELAQHAQDLWQNYFSKAEDKPVFISLNLETPLGLTSFIANNANLQKVYIPSTFNMTKILTSLKTQESHMIVCDQELYQLEPPKAREQEFSEMAKSVQRIIVATTKKLGISPLFQAGDVTSVDPYKLQ